MIYSTITMAAAILLSTFTLPLVNAEVTPSEPGPNSVFREGQTCRITWNADTAVGSVWKNMNIQLMTGDNFAMVHITTVATAQDGTIDGVFEYPCPDVTKNAPIYFYQFTSPETDIKTWTTRFTIASATGEVAPAENGFQPNATKDPVPWGVGALANPASAVAPPQIGCGCENGSQTTTTTTNTPPSNIVANTTITDKALTPAGQTTTTTSSNTARMIVTVTSSIASTPSGDATNTSLANARNGALGNVVNKSILYTALVPLTAWLISF